MLFSRLKEFKDTFRLVVFTLDILSQNFPIITSVVGLPHDCLYILPTTIVLGGIVIVTSNSLIYVDQAARRITLPINGWASRMSDLPFAIPPGEEDRDLSLEGSRSVFVDDKTLFITLKDGTVYPVEIVADGKSVSKLVMSAAIAQTAVPSLMKKLDDHHIFIASTVGPSALVKATKVEEEVDDDEAMDAVPTTVVDTSTTMDVDDDDDGMYHFPLDTNM